MKKTLPTLFLAWMLLASGSNIFSQNATTKQTKKQTIEVLVNDHEYIIKQPISDILKKYWPEKWLDTVRTHMLIEINKEREKAGLLPLRANDTLHSAAQGQANFIANNKETYFNAAGNLIGDPHMVYLPDGKKRGVEYRAFGEWYGSPRVSENITIGKQTIKEVVIAWLNEPLHRQILLDAWPQEGGIGIALLWDGYETIHMTGYAVVMDYGKPDPKHRKRKTE